MPLDITYAQPVVNPIEKIVLTSEDGTRIPRIISFDCSGVLKLTTVGAEYSFYVLPEMFKDFRDAINLMIPGEST